MKFLDILDVEALFQLTSPRRLRRLFNWRESIELAEEVLGEKYTREAEAIEALHRHYNDPEDPKECTCGPANGRRWMIDPVKYYYDAAGETIAQSPLIDAVARAIMAECGLVLVKTEDPRESHITIRNMPLDGRGGTLGQAYVPASGDDMAACGAMCGDIDIDTAENWTRASFATVFMHELLHAVGLPHNSDKRSVMYPQYRGPRGLHLLDKAELLRRYPRRNIV